VPGTPWTVLLEFPRGPILADAHAVATRLALLTGAAALVGLLIAWTLTRRTMQPLAELAEASRAIAAGDRARRMRARSGDEFGEVADAFNRMAAQVEQARARLEEKVEQRTRELRASEAQFHTLAATAHDAIVMADAAGRITYFNPAAERSFGWSAAEVCGQLLTLLMPDRFHTAHLEGLQRYAATGRARILGRTLELTARRRDGTEFPVELSIASLGAAGAAGFAGILRDVTERRLAHDALRRSEAELRVANAELEAFSYSVSHDLRAPLRSIDGFSQALLEDAGEALPPPAREHLERVRAASQRMARLIDDLLALAQVTRTELASERVDLSALAREVVADLRRHRERDVEVTVAPGLEANGDRQLLRLVFENLIGNAWKFTAGRPGARIDVGAERLNGATVFHVRDNGAGFDMTFAHKLFTPFQRLHGQAEFDGTGIGLATVQRVVHRHGGRVWAEGEVGRGATVRFTLDPSGPQENPHGS
jgi:PAS domain S-box-containing protein